MQSEGKLPEGVPKKYPNAMKAYGIIARSAKPALYLPTTRAFVLTMVPIACSAQRMGDFPRAMCYNLSCKGALNSMPDRAPISLKTACNEGPAAGKKA